MALTNLLQALAGLGGLLAIALPEGQRSLGRFVFALGLLLLGLDTMKTAVEVVGTRFELAVLQGLPPIVYLLVGVGLTALIQSSSASMLISLAALNGGTRSSSQPEGSSFCLPREAAANQQAVRVACLLSDAS